MKIISRDSKSLRKINVVSVRQNIDIEHSLYNDIELNKLKKSDSKQNSKALSTKYYPIVHQKNQTLSWNWKWSAVVIIFFWF